MAGKVKRAARAVALAPRRAASRVREVIVQRAAPLARRASQSRVATRVMGQSGSRRRRAAAVVGRTAGAIGIAQARILPSTIGGYAIGWLEEKQRVAHSEGINSEAKKSGAIVANPTYRLIAELAALAMAGAKTSGLLREVVCGAAGGVGALYQMYSSTSGHNPADEYIKTVEAGGSGI